MEIEVIESPYLKSNMYVLSEDNHSIMIDPCENYQMKPGIRLDNILLTHEHYDHISGVNYWKNLTNAQIICSFQCSQNIMNAKKNMSQYFNTFYRMQAWVKVEGYRDVMPYECKEADIIFKERMEMEWQNHKFFFFETPGHSKGSCSILLDDKWLFSGDTLMKDYPIAYGPLGGSKKDWVNKSKDVLQNLPKDIKVMPGHFESFLLGEYKFWEVV